MRKIFTAIVRTLPIVVVAVLVQTANAQNACNPGRIYDQIQSGFHTTIATRPNGTFTTWGEQSAPNGTTSNLVPVDITVANGFAFTGTPLFASLGSNSSNSVQMFLMTTDGLYAWGTRGVVVQTAVTTGTAFQLITMPPSVTPANVSQMIATQRALALVTTTGEVWISGTMAQMYGSGPTLPAAATPWRQVTTSAVGNPILTNVVDLRITPRGAMAVTSSGQWYTWGTSTYLGDGSAPIARDYATPMTAPFVGLPKMITMTSDGTNPSYFALHPTNGMIYALGNNTYGQLGRGNTTAQAGWVTVQASAGVDLTNVVMISGNDQDGRGQEATMGAITSTERLFLWGSNSGPGMGGGTTADGTMFTYPRSPNGFVFGTDVPLYVEVGGHTSAYLKECADRYCYIGHKINGSMGDNVSAASFIPSFDCANTPQALICGASSYDGGDVPVSFENNNAAAHYYRCPPGIYLGALGPTGNNGNPANVAANADNTGVNGDGLEEDGIASLPIYTGSGTYSLTVTGVNTSGSVGNMTAWVDWNGNGIFEPTEYQGTTVPSMAGTQTRTFTWTVPAVTCGKKYVRIRFTTDLLTDNVATAIDERSIGAAIGGEVEDYFVQTTVPTSAGPDQHLVCNTQATCGTNLAGIGLGVWAAHPGNPGTATITTPTANNSAVSNFSAPGTYRFIFTSGTCVDTMQITFNVKPNAVNDTPTTPENTPVTINLPGNDTDFDGNLNPGSVVILTPPTNGTYTLNAITGELTYTPNLNFNGSTTFQYRICDFGTPILCDTASVTITVSAVNNPPQVNANSATTPEDIPVAIHVLANDTDVDGNLVPSSVTVTSGPANGTTSVDPITGIITYTPNPNFYGTDTFIYQACDDGTPLPALCDTAVVTVTVTPVNDPPVANHDIASTNEDTPVTIPVLGNDTSVDGNLVPGSVVVGTPPANGTVYVNNISGEITYTPNPNFYGTDTFIYQVCDDGIPLPAMCDTAVVTITVNPVNDPPIAINDTNITPEDTPVSGNVSTNDSDVDGPDAIYTLVTGPANGTLVFNPDGTYTYTPDTNYYGVDIFTYQLCDGGTPNLCATATVTITVTPINDPPVANADNATTNEDTPVVIPVLGNDFDIDGSLVTGSVASVTLPANGTISINALTGEITYTPNHNFFGTDTFIYQVCDNGTPLPSLCDTAVVTITVNPVNDPPTAVNDVNTTLEDTPVSGNVSTNDTDIDGPGTPTFSLVTSPSNGAIVFNTDGTYTYTPDSNYYGIDVFTYQICDGGTPNLCDTATVTITVTPVNDPPIAVDDFATTPEDVPVYIFVLGNDSDVDGVLQTTSVAIVTPPTNGTTFVNPATGVITYTPNPDYNGVDSFSYIVCDNGTPLPALCDTAVVTITVTPVNDSVMVDIKPIVTNEDSTTGTICFSIIDDPADDHIATLCGVLHGSATVSVDNGTDQICVVYTPNPDYYGADDICIVVCDSGTPTICDTIHIPVTVLPINDPPIVNADFATTNEDVPVVINVLANDTDIDGALVPNTVAIGTQPANGTVVVNAVTGEITYTPNPNFFGTDTFIYQVCDNGTPLPSLCDTAVVTVTVNPVNDAPVANPDNVTTPEDTPIAINVPANDTDVDGNLDPTTVSVVTGPTNGTVTVDPITGVITYTPNPDYNGTDVFTYSICDTGMPVLCSTTTVTVTVTPVNDPPVINFPDVTTPEDVPVTVCSPITDPDLGNIFTATVCGGPLNGAISGPAVFNGQVCLTYTPTLNYNGVDSICVIVCDNFGACDTSTTVITVTPVNDPPVANPDNVTTPEDTPIAINVPANDTDVDGNLDPTTVSVVTGPANGTVTVDPITGVITYTPNPNYNGTDVFTYSICDTGMPVLCSTTTVTVTVTPVNDPPVIDFPDVTTPEDVPVTVCSPITDPDLGNIFTATVCGGPLNGTISGPAVFNGQVCLTYTPTLNYNGVDSICVIVCDNFGACDTSTTVITVTPVNDPPVANPDNVTTPEDTPIAINVPANDTDVDGNLDPTTVSVVTGPANGTVTVDPITGVITYTPNPNYNGTDVFTYSICDTGMPVLCSTTTVTIVVTPVNDPPVIDFPDVTTPEDVPVTVCSPITDPDENNTFTATLCNLPSNGTASTPTIFNGQVCVTYTPALNYNGLDSICVIVCDQNGACDTSTTVITVTPVNDPPIAINDINTTNEDTPVSGNVSTNDDTTDGPDDIYTLVTSPTNGTITFNADGTYDYTPNPNFTGVDAFTYQLCDNGTPNLCDTATVTITINPVNDPPIANADFATTNEDVPVVINVLANDTDVDGILVPNTVAIGTQPTNGTVVVNAVTGEITYTPNPNFFGTDTFIYQVCDNGTPLPSLCDTAVVTVTVNPVNDAPVANPDNVTTPEDTPIAINVPANDTDVDGNLDPTTVSVVTGPTNGTVTVDPITGVITYTPNPDYNGTDVFTYSICDTGMPVLCSTTTVTVTVTPVNDPPVIDFPDVTTPEETPITICSPITDPDVGNTFSAALCGGSSNGTITGPTVFNGQVCLTYTPTLNYNGLDSICVIVCDQNGACDTSTTVITVTPVNDPPVANPDNVTTPEDIPVVINVSGNDTDVDGNIDPTTVSIVNGPTNGIVTVDPVTGAVTYNPNPNYNGTDVFTYTICDTGTPIYCDTTTVTVTITPVNDPPVINFPDVTTPEETPITICSPITDPDVGDTFTAGLCGGPFNGTVTGPTVFNGQVCITYTSTLNYNGLDSICVILCDQNGLCDTSTTVITVTPVNDPPIAVDDTTSTGTNTPVIITVISNDTDVDGGIDPTSVTVIIPPTQGTASVDPSTGVVTYTPNANACGTDSFVYQVCDLGTPLPALCDQAMVTITINDTQAPAITCPANFVSSNTANQCGFAVTGTALNATATDNCSTVSLTHNYTAWPNANSLQGATFPIGTTTVVWTAVDLAGNTSTCSFDVTINDTQAPAFLNCASGDTITMGLFAGDCEGGSIWPIPFATDNCTNVTITQTAGPALGSILPVGIYPITYTATDVAGNATTCSFTFRIIDTQTPTIVCPVNVLAVNTTPGICGWIAPAGSLSPLLAQSNCNAAITWSVLNPDATTTNGTNNVSGYTFGLGTSTVTYTITENASGQSTSCSFTVTVSDNQAPIFAGCPVNMTVSNDAGSCTAIINWTAPTASDNCAVTSFTSTHNPGDSFPVGTTTVTYTSVDAAGNTSICTFNVTVNDTELPVITGCPTNVTVNSDAGICGAVVTWTLPTITDNCGVTITSTHNSGDVFPLGTTTVIYNAVDAAGNAVSCSFTVTVADNQAPTFDNCPADITVSNFFNTCYQQVYWPTVTASDNCGTAGVVVTTTHAPGFVFNVGTTTVTYTATDVAGNSTTCTFNVTVNDTQVPTIQNCPADITVNNNNGICGAVVVWTQPAIFDNCPNVTVSSTHNPGDTFPVGTTTVTYTVTDVAGNTATCTFNVTVNDTQAPVIAGCPANINVSNTPGVCGAVVNWTVPTITDNCPGVTFTSTHSSGDTFPIGITTVTYTATDVAGNVSTCTFNVTVSDTELPTITSCPTNIAVNTDAGICGAVINWTVPTITDNCAGLVVTSSHTPGSTFAVGTTTVTYTATDAVGNVSVCSFDVTVTDNLPPVLANCPADINVGNAFNFCGSPISWVAPTFTDNCLGMTVVASHTNGTVFPIGTTVVTYTATDISGNVTVCTFNITITDTQVPQITNCPPNITVSGNPSCSAVVSWTVPSAFDNCPGVVLTSSHNPGDVFTLGTTTVVYTATDAANNTITCSFDVIVTDNSAPVITNCPASIIVSNDAGVCGAAVTWIAPTITDNCSTPTVTSTHNPGDVFPIGATTVTYMATDVVGNVSTCSFTVTVNDAEAPTITNCPTNVAVNNTPGACGAVVTWTAPVITDNCPGVTFTSTHTSGSTFPIGNTTVTYTATDAKGNMSICTFTVTVTDNEAPVLSNCPADITVNQLFNICGAPVLWTPPTFTDNCSAGLVVTTSHLPGTTFPAGTTTVTYTATDASGNVTICTFDITVNDTQAPVITTCPINTTINSNPGICGATYTWVLPTALDNCPGVVLTTTHAPGSTFPVGTTTVTYTATDVSGNTATCSFDVTVVDVEAPVITNCPANVTVSNTVGNCDGVATWTAPTATDNCGVASLTSSHNIGDVFPVGTTTVVYTATDSAGNVTYCRFNVIVNDTELPVIAGCPVNINSCTDTITWIAPTATDNCSIMTLTSTHNSGDVFPVGTTTVTYTATDSAGNVSTCSFNVTVSMPKLTVVYEDVSCNGAKDGTATVIVTDAVGPLTFNWGTAGTDSIATGLAPGTYTVVVSDGIGCSATASVTITEPTVLTVDTVSISIGSCGFADGSAIVVANGGTAPYSYSWSNGQSSATLTSVGDGFYTVTVTDANGCQDSLTINVSCEIKEIPQLLTPNGDGHNDTWVIPGIEKYPNATVEVYNRWGNQVFKSAPYLNDWAGISTGMLNVGKDTLPAGTYFYVIRLHPEDKKAMTGYIELQY
jgi:gliding motility-associated-like protein